MLYIIPNLASDDVPIGKDSKSNKIIEQSGTKKEFPFSPKSHIEIGLKENQIDFDTSVKLHNIRKLIIINHRDCGVAKIINGKKEFSKLNETLVHRNSFQKIKKIFKRKYPKLRIELKLISLNSKVETF